ncbi:abortive infection bacteriophage resistance protein [Idiomarina sp. A28L]|uniref:Abi family protein n=1 Tax=Idiomarina sp. A28L TaxID=1036674 RepID=UPI0002138660|nr:Abi family protein [Idiomarina sp. A28L]EGN75240.1 abortive infection bacteriophage resistance protein [Idiomarina sp. A28L]
MTYNRPWKSFPEQLELLKSRGMIVTDETAALDYLERVGYYRLSAYWYPFRKFEITQGNETGKLSTKALNEFHADTQFVDAVHLYLFDKKLRLYLADALERIEVSLRVDLSYLLGSRDPFAHVKNIKEHFHPTFSNRPFYKGSQQSNFDAWLTKYRGLVSRSKEDFVRHYHDHHGKELPVWVAVELLDFGAISQLFSMLNVKDQKTIALRYGVPNWQVFKSWLYSLSYLRNLVAHHSRLWNRNITSKPMLPQQGEISWCDYFIGTADYSFKPFLLLSITRMLVKSICPRTQWHKRVLEHLKEFPEQHSNKKLNLNGMGITEEWEEWW